MIGIVRAAGNNGGRRIFHVQSDIPNNNQRNKRFSRPGDSGSFVMSGANAAMGLLHGVINSADVFLEGILVPQQAAVLQERAVAWDITDTIADYAGTINGLDIC